MKNDYVLRGDVTEIVLRGPGGSEFRTLIDTVDLELVNSFPNSWHCSWAASAKKHYVCGFSPLGQGRYRRIRLHRFLLNPPSELVVDHINHDGLDNRRSNLRVTTHVVNALNRRGPSINNKSGIRGVHWNAARKQWRANLMFLGHQYHLGYFDDLHEAEATFLGALDRVNKGLAPL